MILRLQFCRNAKVKRISITPVLLRLCQLPRTRKHVNTVNEAGSRLFAESSEGEWRQVTASSCFHW